MSSVRSLIAAHKPGDEESLRSLAVALSAVLRDTPTPPTDPVAVYDAGETSDYDQPGTWQEVRSERDFGNLTDSEYDYLAAAVEALTMEEHNG